MRPRRRTFALGADVGVVGDLLEAVDGAEERLLGELAAKDEIEPILSLSKQISVNNFEEKGERGGYRAPWG